jgi:hypothetical protein
MPRDASTVLNVPVASVSGSRRASIGAGPAAGPASSSISISAALMGGLATLTQWLPGHRPRITHR